MSSLVVKPYQPWKIRILVVMALIVLGLIGLALFEYGRYSAGYDSIEIGNKQELLLNNLDGLQEKIEILREEKAVLERSAQIERQAYDELDTTLKVLQGEILELKSELAFYRGIVSPRDASEGLHLQSFKIVPNGTKNGYRYKVVLTQVLNNDQLARGAVELSMEGLQGQEPVKLGLRDLTEKSIKVLEYRFKYFQNIEGDIILPKDFVAQRMTIKVQPQGRRQEPIVKTFDWPHS